MWLVELDNTVDGIWKLAVVSFYTTAGLDDLNSFIRFGARDTNASVWLFDEVMVQEGLNVASTWLPKYIDDQSSNQGVYGNLIHYNDIKIATWGDGVIMTNAAGTITKRVRLNDAGDGLIYEDE